MNYILAVLQCLIVIAVKQWLIRAEIIMLKYLAVAAEVNFLFQFCLQSCMSIGYTVGKFYLTDDTRFTLILR